MTALLRGFNWMWNAITPLVLGDEDPYAGGAQGHWLPGEGPDMAARQQRPLSSRERCAREGGFYQVVGGNARCITPAERGCIAAGRRWVNGQCQPLPQQEQPTQQQRQTGGGAQQPTTQQVAPPPVEQPRAEAAPTAAPQAVRRGRETAQDVFQAALPAWNPRAELVGAFQPASWGDAIRDPRFLAAAADQEERLRAAGAAAGVRGAPLLSGIASGQQELLGGLAGVLHEQDRSTWEANLARSAAEAQRAGQDWQQRWQPAQAAMDYGLRESALGHGQWLSDQDLGLRRQAQAWQQWWAPEEQQRQFGQQARMQASGQAASAAAQDRALRNQILQGAINTPYQPGQLTTPW